MVMVIFRYIEDIRKWEPIVVGAKDEREAKQAFNGVLLTCDEPLVGMQHQVKEFNTGEFNGPCFEIIPAIQPKTPSNII